MRKTIKIGVIALLIVIAGIAGILVYKAITSKPMAARSDTIYYCPMHPTYTSPRPGTCPICGMTLVPMKKGEDHKEHLTASNQEAMVEGRITISISAEKQQKIGVRTERIEKKTLSKTIQFTAVLEHDETRYARIAPRFSGWIQKLFANYTGQQINKGEPLMSVYSPDVLSATTEYLLAFEQFEKVKNNPAAPEYERAKNLLDSARKKLSLWEIGQDEIEQIEKARRPLSEILLRSPITGHIIAKTAFEGRYYMPGETLFEIGDLSKLWVRAYVYEQDYPFVKLGQKARVIFPYLNKSFEGSISFIYPHIDAKTRRAEVRINIENQGDILRPGMWGNIEIDVDYGELTLIPRAAVIDTGMRYIAFVVKEDGEFEPRELKIGFKGDDYYQVVEGARESEKVVANPLFLIDSESQLKAAILGMGSHKH
ncbi:MAG: efflux RND transporter periplasmic adaptor subunit [Verrucomicrobiia bacterium]